MGKDRGLSVSNEGAGHFYFKLLSICCSTSLMYHNVVVISFERYDFIVIHRGKTSTYLLSLNALFQAT